jgi:hypothetical protein
MAPEPEPDLAKRSEIDPQHFLLAQSGSDGSGLDVPVQHRKN